MRVTMDIGNSAHGDGGSHRVTVCTLSAWRVSVALSRLTPDNFNQVASSGGGARFNFALSTRTYCQRSFSGMPSRAASSAAMLDRVTAALEASISADAPRNAPASPDTPPFLK